MYVTGYSERGFEGWLRHITDLQDARQRLKAVSDERQKYGKEKIVRFILHAKKAKEYKL
jgi:hypothetical protein